jgi:hypothetical protein
MTKRILIWLLAISFVANVSVAQAQQPTKVPRIGYLTAGSLSSQSARIGNGESGRK